MSLTILWVTDCYNSSRDLIVRGGRQTNWWNWNVLEAPNCTHSNYWLLYDMQSAAAATLYWVTASSLSADEILYRFTCHQENDSRPTAAQVLAGRPVYFFGWRTCVVRHAPDALFPCNSTQRSGRNIKATQE